MTRTSIQDLGYGSVLYLYHPRITVGDVILLGVYRPSYYFFRNNDHLIEQGSEGSCNTLLFVLRHTHR